MPLILIHVQHLVGIGHLMRARRVAEALAAAGHEVHLVSGGMPVDLRAPTGVRTVQLPPLRVTDGNFAVLRDAAGEPVDAAYLAHRRDLLLAAYEAAGPAAVIVETFPFGRRALRFELVPLLERVAAARPRPRVFTSVRDILQQGKSPEREREMLDAANRWLDAVLVHGDARFARIEDSFAPARELAPPIHYTGFVAAHRARPGARSRGAGSARGEAIGARDEVADDGGDAAVGARDEVVVSAGGGAVGAGLLSAAVAARAQSRLAHLTWRILAGANASDETLRRLTRDAGPGLVVERARADFPALLSRAVVSVSQAGYNTVLDAARSGARAVLVPYAEHGETEQTARAKRLGELGLAVVIGADALTPATLAAAIDAAAERDGWGTWDFDCCGAARTAEIVGTMIAEGMSCRT